MTTGTVPSKSQIVKWWLDHNNLQCSGLEPYFIIHDIGEPDCWACKRSNPNFNDISAYLEYKSISNEAYHKNPDKYISAMWNDSRLQRHHIVPVSRGGTNDISNLVLLCSGCHVDAPHLDNYSYFWNWLKNREQEIIDKYTGGIKSSCSLAGLDFEKNTTLIQRSLIYYQLNKGNKSNDFIKEIEKILTFHPGSNWESHFRDRMFCLFTVVRSNPYLIPGTISEILDGVKR